MAAHNELGKWGESIAAGYLERKGYTIIERDWHSGRKDIDIIAADEDEQVVVFVEVKTRRNNHFGEPEEAIDYQKRQNLIHAINHYVRYKQIRHDIRFDVISVVGTIGSEPKIKHIKDVALI